MWLQDHRSHRGTCPPHIFRPSPTALEIPLTCKISYNKLLLILKLPTNNTSPQIRGSSRPHRTTKVPSHLLPNSTPNNLLFPYSSKNAEQPPCPAAPPKWNPPTHRSCRYRLGWPPHPRCLPLPSLSPRCFPLPSLALLQVQACQLTQ